MHASRLAPSIRRARALALLLVLPWVSACSTVLVLDDDDDDAHGNGGAGSGGAGAGAGGGVVDPASCVARATDPLLSAYDGSIDTSSAVPGPDCGMFAAGSYFGDAVFGGQALAWAEDWDGWLVRLDAGGDALWAKRFASSGDLAWSDHVYAVLSDASGNSWITAHGGALDLGNGQVLDGLGSFAMALDPQGGVRWARRLTQFPRHAELRADGQLALLTNDGPVQLLLLDGASGEITSETTIASGTVDLMGAASAGGRTALALCFRGQLSIGDLTLEASDDTLDGLEQETCDLALAVVDPAGQRIHARRFLEHGFSPYLMDVAVDERGVVALTGSFWGRIDLGLGELAASPIGSGMRGMVAIFDPQGGAIASSAFGDAEFVFPNGLVLADDGSLTIGATMYVGSVNLGGGQLGPTSAYLGFEGTFDASGQHLESFVHEGLTHLFPAEAGAALWVDETLEPADPPNSSGNIAVRIDRRATAL